MWSLEGENPRELGQTWSRSIPSVGNSFTSCGVESGPSVNIARVCATIDMICSFKICFQGHYTIVIVLEGTVYDTLLRNDWCIDKCLHVWWRAHPYIYGGTCLWWSRFKATLWSLPLVATIDRYHCAHEPNHSKLRFAYAHMKIIKEYDLLYYFNWVNKLKFNEKHMKLAHDLLHWLV